VVEITPSAEKGWRVISGEDAPVRFRRPRGMLALPTPALKPDGANGLLRRFFNVSGEDDLRLIVAWLVAALRPTGPYPVLLLQGEQGSAKSTAERLVRSLVDPSAAPLRTTPRSEHDLFIAADNAHIIALDNISTLQPWLSDALCRLSTGGGFSTRTLYENRDEELFDGMKPVILNGITDVVSRPDLLDRALIVSLPPIPEEERRREDELWREFERMRPAILASLFDAVSGALRSVGAVRLEGLPRMADFAVWATAAEESLGWKPGAFMTAYTGNREEATDTALEADPVAGAVLSLMSDRDEWAGTASELWSALNELVDEDIRRTRAWPGAPNALTGRLKRLAPTLRSVGIEYGEDRTGRDRSRTKTLTRKKNKPANDRPHRPQGANSAKESRIRADGPADGPVNADGRAVRADGPQAKDRLQEKPVDKPNTPDADDADDVDNDLQRDSKSSWENDPMRFYQQGHIPSSRTAPTTRRVHIPTERKAGRPYEDPHVVYIGREYRRGPYNYDASVWANPFTVEEHGRERAVELYREYILNTPELLARLGELRGKVLACWCEHGEDCHGDVLIELLSREEK
jgi:hypothetical protein